jgi:hypothetical protein
MVPVNERSYHCIIESVEESQPVAQENTAGHDLFIVASSKRNIGRGSNLGQAHGKRQAGKHRRRCLPAIAEESMGVPIGVCRRWGWIRRGLHRELEPSMPLGRGI